MRRARSLPRIICGALILVASFTTSVAAAPDNPMGLRAPSSAAASIAEQALQTRADIKRGDFSDARATVTNVLDNSRIQGWRYHPFGDFIRALSTANDPILEQQLDAWVAQQPEDAIPRLIRAQYRRDMAWFVRGGGFVHAVSDSALASFADYLKRALEDINSAPVVKLNNPYGALLKLRIMRGFGLSSDLMSAFEEGIAKFPAYYPLYEMVLALHHPKWGGSVDGMYAFVYRYAGDADENSPLKLLYLSLYRHLLNLASMSCPSGANGKDTRAQCVTLAMRQLVKPQLEESLLAALELYDRTDKYEFGLALDDILSEMLGTGGAESHAATILELAARAMRSNTQLKTEEPGRNDYIVDKLVALSWYRKSFYDNALIKGQEALRSIENSRFPSDVEKDVAVAGLYQALARTHYALNHYQEMVGYEKAAVALGGATTEEYFICYGHYRLKQYEDGIRACTKAIANNPGNMKAHYWRARAYRDLGKPDEALQDFKAVADSQDGFRASAAIDVSMILFSRKDLSGALAALNEYTYLYDPELTRKSDVAVGYNNRCYAYMEMGELMKALEDCKASLKYGNLPDAYRKQLELVKRLGAEASKF